MSLKSRLALLSMFAALSLPQPEARSIRRLRQNKSMRDLHLAEIERKKANGMKEFFYGEKSVWALNKENADRKAKKLNYLQ